MSLTTRVLLALLLGTGAGLALRAYPSPAAAAIVSFVEPVGTLWVNAIRMTIVPLVVSLLITGVAASNDMRAVRAIGLRTLATFLVLLVLCGVFALIIVPPMFAGLHVDAATVASLRGSASTLPPTADLPGLADWIVSIIPTNPIKAAADGALLPLVVFALAFGLGLLSISAERRAGVLVVIAGIGDTMMVIVGAIIALAPIGVFALMVPVVSRTGLSAAGALAYYVGVTAIAQTLFLALLYPMVAFAARISPMTFARAVLPAQAVAIASSSSLASLPALLEGADRRLRIPSTVAGVVLPLAVSTFKIGTPLLWLIAVVFLGHLYGVALGPTQLVAVSVTALLTSFSTPGVPHGWLLVIAPLVVALGIPAESIGLLIAVDAVPDIFATTLNVTADMAAAAMVSRQTKG
jgi:proton glutamate symport protein